MLTLIATAVGMATISGQPAGVEGIEYVVSTLHARTLTCDSPSTTWSPREIGSRIRWTLRGANTGPMLGQPPSGQPVEMTAIVIFRIANGKMAERLAAFSPTGQPER